MRMSLLTDVHRASSTTLFHLRCKPGYQCVNASLRAILRKRSVAHANCSMSTPDEFAKPSSCSEGNRGMTINGEYSLYTSSPFFPSGELLPSGVERIWHALVDMGYKPVPLNDSFPLESAPAPSSSHHRQVPLPLVRNRRRRRWTLRVGPWRCRAQHPLPPTECKISRSRRRGRSRSHSLLLF